MNKTRIKVLILSLWLVGGSARADFLTDILTGQFDVKTVPTITKDSLLNGTQITNGLKPAQTRVYQRGVWGPQVKTRMLSPNGKYELYAKNNNLYVYKRDFKTDLAITHDTLPYLFNGVADWLYNEEFDCGAMWAWSTDSKFVAFVRLNDKDVASFEWQEVLASGEGYPVTQSLNYPRVGTANPIPQLCLYDIQYKDIRTIDLGEVGYMPRLRFAGEMLYVQTLNRDQNEMKIYQVNPKSGVAQLWYREQCADGWINYANIDEWQWLSDGRVIVVSDKSGWRQVYLYASNGKQIRQLTADGHDVTQCYGYDEKTKTLYYQVANTPMTRQNIAMRLDDKGIKKSLSALDDGKGWCELSFSKDYTRYLKSYQSETVPNKYMLYVMKRGQWQSQKEPTLDAINDKNEAALSRWQEAGGKSKQFFSFVTERGDTLYGWCIVPVSGEGSPLVLMHYSGPGSQRVVEKWKKKFEYALAAEGYVVACVDVRGTGGRGQRWLHKTYLNLGVKEAEDLVSTARWLCNEGLKNEGLKIDPERMAIGGWSYGGFETLMTMSRDDSPFKCGFAIAPVTDYRLYDSGYTERFMRRLQVNDRGYMQCALPEMAERLKGRLLIVHGLADDNVHCQNTWLYIDALVRAGKQFNMQVYPDDNHYLRKRGNYEHLHRRLVEFLNDEMTK